MPSTFVICATQRSGSTMVCDDFANTECLGKPTEHFYHFLHNDTPRPFDVADIMKHGRDVRGNMSVKVMANYLANVDDALPSDHPLNGLHANFYFSFQSAIWFYVQRRELDRQALSRVRAAQSGIYHLKNRHGKIHVGSAVMSKDLLDKKNRIRYSRELKSALLDEIIKIRSEEQVWKKFFDDWNIKPFEIVYEDVADASTNYLAHTLRTLGIMKETALPARSLSKLSDEISDEIIDKFRDELNRDGVELPVQNRSIYEPSDPQKDRHRIRAD